MENHSESQSFNWFDDLPVGHVIVVREPNTRRALPAPNNAIVVVPPPPTRERRGVPIWVLAFSALAGASTFVLGAALMQLL
jgi:hypothetical protein